MASSVKTHRRTQRVKAGPKSRVKKSMRAERVENRRASHTRWMASWMGVDPRSMPEWGIRHEYEYEQGRRQAGV